MPEVPIAIIGAGAWGTAIALYLTRIGFSVKIWAREPETVENIKKGENKEFLPGVSLPDEIEPTGDIDEALNQSRVIFIAVPTQYIRNVIALIHKSRKTPKRIFVNLAKGIERKTARLPSEIIEDILPETAKVISLSGPSFAAEVAAEKPTVLVAAGNLEAAGEIQHKIASPSLRIYTSDDRFGVELSGALKNVIALAAGIADGLNLGENARAALIVRGLAEMYRLGIALGAKPRTVFGIAGLGDLVLTSTGGLSRNHKLGYMIGCGETLDDILPTVPWIAEGVYTAPAALELAGKNDVELPITEQVVKVLEKVATPSEAVKNLMTRPLKPEFPGNMEF